MKEEIYLIVIVLLVIVITYLVDKLKNKNKE